MMERSSGQLHCIVVTPERAVLDEKAEFVAVPMFDGELGVLPGRAPLIGRLGAGALRIRQGGSERKVFIDGGFLQIRSDAVTLLTPRATPVENLDVAAAEAELRAAQEKKARNPSELESINKAQASARTKLRIARKK